MPTRICSFIVRPLILYSLFSSLLFSSLLFSFPSTTYYRRLVDTRHALTLSTRYSAQVTGSSLLLLLLLLLALLLT